MSLPLDLPATSPSGTPETAAGRAGALLGLHQLPAAPTRGDGGDAGGPRFAGRDAHRGGEVDLLPGPGAGRRRGGPGRVAAHLADEGPGRHPGRQRRLGRLLQQRAVVRAEAGGDGRGARGPLPPALRLARAAGRRGRRRVPRPGRLGRRAGAVRGHRRGPLHQPVGPRLPAGLPPARPAARPVPGGQPARLHRHRDRAGAARHRRSARAARSAGAGRLLRSARTSSTASCRAPR